MEKLLEEKIDAAVDKALLEFDWGKVGIGILIGLPILALAAGIWSTIKANRRVKEILYKAESEINSLLESKMKDTCDGLYKIGLDLQSSMRKYPDVIKFHNIRHDVDSLSEMDTYIGNLRYFVKEIAEYFARHRSHMPRYDFFSFILDAERWMGVEVESTETSTATTYGREGPSTTVVRTPGETSTQRELNKRLREFDVLVDDADEKASPVVKDLIIAIKDVIDKIIKRDYR
jgi:hypothetical protein